MKLTAALMAIVLSFSFASGAIAAERYDHHQGATADTVEEALSNLETYNEELESILAKDQLSDADMGRIHRISYTLENALGRIEEELEDAAASLEELHLGSEQLQRDRAQENGRDYLDHSRRLIAR